MTQWLKLVLTQSNAFAALHSHKNSAPLLIFLIIYFIRVAVLILAIYKYNGIKFYLHCYSTKFSLQQQIKKIYFKILHLKEQLNVMYIIINDQAICPTNFFLQKMRLLWIYFISTV